MAKKSGVLQLVLLIIGGILVFFGFWFLMILAFINNANSIGFGLMLSIFTIPLGIATGTRLASPKKKRRKRRKRKRR